jgi:hypothetical protein
MRLNNHFFQCIIDIYKNMTIIKIFDKFEYLNVLLHQIITFLHDLVFFCIILIFRYIFLLSVIFGGKELEYFLKVSSCFSYAYDL